MDALPVCIAVVVGLPIMGMFLVRLLTWKLNGKFGD
jgi:hypothetical protein